MPLELRLGFAHIYKHTQWYAAFSKTLLFPLSPGLCSCSDSWANSFAELILWFVMLPAVPLQSLLFLCKVCTEHFHNYNLPKAEINEDCIHCTKDAFVLPFSALKIGSFKAFTIEGKNILLLRSPNPISFQWSSGANVRFLNTAFSSSLRWLSLFFKTKLSSYVCAASSRSPGVQSKPNALRWWHLHLRWDPKSHPTSPPQKFIYLKILNSGQKTDLAWLFSPCFWQAGEADKTYFCLCRHRQGEGVCLSYHQVRALEEAAQRCGVSSGKIQNPPGHDPM